MASGREDLGLGRRPLEKHGWLRLDRYQEIHERTLERNPFVLADHTEFLRVVDRRTLLVTLEGTIECEGGIVIEVNKTFAVRVSKGREEIRTVFYRYTARLPGRGNILRYDNLHEEAPDEYHRHEFDLETWTQSRKQILTREQIPTLGEVVEEVEEIARTAGLI